MKTRFFHQVANQPKWLAFTFIVIAILNLFFLVWSGRVNALMPYDGLVLTSDDRVEKVISGSPAAETGIRPGDHVIAVNGASLRKMHSPYDGLRPGDQSTYLVIRDSQSLSFTVRLDALPVRSLILAEEPILVGFIFWLTSLFVWLVAPVAPTSWLFFLLGQTAAFMFASGAISTFKRNSLENYLFSVSLILLAPLVAHFYFTFPSPRIRRFQWLLLKIIYVVAALLIIANTIVTFAHSPNRWLYFVASQNLAFVIVVFLIALGSLFAPQRDDTIHSQRQRRLLMAGMVFSVFPVLAFSVLPQSLTGEPFVNYLWTFPFLIVLPVSYAYGVREENLDKFDRLLKRGVIVVILVGIFFAIYYLAFTTLKSIGFPERWRHLAAGLFLILTTALFTPPLSRQLDLLLDRFFYGHWYDYHLIIQQNSQYLSGVIRLDELAKNLLQNARNMRFKAAMLLWADGMELRPYQYFGYPSQVAKSCALNANGAIAQKLISAHGPLGSYDIASIAEQDGLPLQERCFFEKAKVQIWLPLLTRSNELLGVLALGPRQSNEALSNDDWAILSVLATHTSLAAENIHLVETLRRQLERMEQMQKELREIKWRLAENRERERLEMAQLLHDGPIQDIYSVVYQLAIWRKVHNGEDDPELSHIESELMDIEKKLRSFSTELRPPALESFGLEGAIRSHISKLHETNPELEIISDLIPTRDITSPDKNLALFRIYQEAVRNAIRHANANKIWVHLFMEDGEIVLEVEDNGRGFSPPSRWMDLARQGHFGMLGMVERTEAVDGSLEVHSSPGKGTKIRVIVPYE